MSIYDFKVESVQSGEQSLRQYEGKVLLIVNTASKCGFAGQLKDLQHIYEKYRDEGLVVLGFPSNQFMNQEPLSNDEIPAHFEKKYGVTFPIFKKVHVRGEEIDPIFDYLTHEKKGVASRNIKWNFTKFLVGKHGEVIERYSPKTPPDKIESDVQAQL